VRQSLFAGDVSLLRHEDEADDAVGHDEGEVASLVGDPFSRDSQGYTAKEQREPQKPHAP